MANNGVIVYSGVKMIIFLHIALLNYYQPQPKKGKIPQLIINQGSEHCWRWDGRDEYDESSVGIMNYSQ